MTELAATIAGIRVGSEISRPFIEQMCDDCGVDTVVAFLVACERNNNWDCTLQIGWANETRPSEMFCEVNRVIGDLKYLGRLEYITFKNLLFPQATEDYLDEKWLLWNNDRLGFMYSCSSDKIRLLCDYIEICKHGGCGN